MHLHQLPSGNWRVIVQHGGRKRSATRATRAEARIAGAELAIALDAQPKASTVTVAELLDRHLAAARLRDTSRDTYDYARRHVPDDFEALPVADVGPPAIDALYRRLEAAGVSANYVRKVNSLLSGAFKRAVRWGWVAVNPCRDADVPADDEPELRTPSTDEARKLLGECDALSWSFGLFVRVAANTGARRGQVLGLQHRDVGDRQIAIVRGVTYTKRSGLAVGDLKGGRRERRTVAIGQGLADRLTLHMMAQCTEQPLGPDAWLFTVDGRAPWFPSTPTHWWGEARVAAGVDAVRIHDLRHYVATEGFAADIDPRTVMGRLGHRRMSTTMERYAAARPARDRAFAEHLERELGR